MPHSNRALQLSLAAMTALAVVAVASHWIPTAAAQTPPRTVACFRGGNMFQEKDRAELEAWMQAQVTAGKAGFMPLTTQGSIFGACAW